ncbi:MULTISPECIES: DUF6207 family protein [unclassified Streptomyces]|uniref:DUF6207 family protein n=1 Tax=unclassified Streptomyces TaxID=2593676 RepID=UPI00224CABE0|nr:MULTISPECIES: DUF6207 family protein [unclassified Streptomyces]MCX4792739.1 DUF6207 family protein [Streptomyces sp. NBC_01242]WSP60664.1 DUF6207 family protein [Streptomyces sp. NBC_01240]
MYSRTGTAPIHAQHLSEPGLADLHITAPDEATAHTVTTALEQQWATTGIGPVQKAPREPGAEAHMHADTRRLTGPDPGTAGGLSPGPGCCGYCGCGCGCGCQSCWISRGVPATRTVPDMPLKRGLVQSNAVFRNRSY